MKWLAIVTLVACSSGPGKPDAAIDAPPDTKLADAGKCGTGIAFEAEHIDWDSTDAAFCGVFQATWTVHGSSDPLQTHKTSPNGRVEMCLPNSPSVMIDITMPTGPTPCVTTTGSYAVNGVAFTNANVQAMLSATSVFRARSFTEVRKPTFYQAIGAAYDPAKGGLMVHIAGTPVAVTIDVPHDATQRFDGTSWAAGNSGVDVFFPNVPTGTAVVTLGTPGTFGQGTYPIIANTISYITIYSP